MRRGECVVLGILVCLSWSVPVWSGQNATLTSSARLSVGDTLVSPPQRFEFGIFEFGIFQLGNGKYYLCIRYAAPIGQAVVWVANRNQPLTFDKPYLKLSDGNLQLFDQNSVAPLWSSSAPPGPGARVAKLLDTGNLVLEDVSTGNRVWNSFNYSITDTLLPGQYLQRLDPRQNSLTSWLSRNDPTTGNYTFGWGVSTGPNGTNVSILQLACHSCVTSLATGGVYIPAPDVDNPHTIANVDVVYFHPKLGGLYSPPSLLSANSSDLPPASTLILSDFQQPSNTTLKRLTLDTDGGLRIWQWKIGQPSPDWTPLANWVVQERGTQCFAMATCGPFGLCQMTPSGSLDRVQCTCPYGFEPMDETDVSRGCIQIQPLSDLDYCGPSALFNMTELDGVDMPWGGDYDNYTVEPNSANCTARCLGDCNCTGVVYSQDELRCWRKKGLLFNLGYPTVALHGNDRNAKIKISTDQPPPVHHGKDRKWWIFAPVLGGVFGVGVLVWCIYRCRRWTGKTRDPGIPDFGGPDSAT